MPVGGLEFGRCLRVWEIREWSGNAGQQGHLISEEEQGEPQTIPGNNRFHGRANKATTGVHRSICQAGRVC